MTVQSKYPAVFEITLVVNHYVQFAFLFVYTVEGEKSYIKTVIDFNCGRHKDVSTLQNVLFTLALRPG